MRRASFTLGRFDLSLGRLSANSRVNLENERRSPADRPMSLDGNATFPSVADPKSKYALLSQRTYDIHLFAMVWSISRRAGLANVRFAPEAAAGGFKIVACP